MSRRPAVVTVEHLRTRTCWICAMGDDDDDVPDDADELRFVHACDCTLVAHETCLSGWIQQQSSLPEAQLPVRCPQCLHAYRLVFPKPLLLSLFERLAPWATLAANAAGFSAILAGGREYGKLALRVWVGTGAANKFAENTKGNPLAVLGLTSVPWVLLAAHLPGYEFADFHLCHIATACNLLANLSTIAKAANRLTAPSNSVLLPVTSGGIGRAQGPWRAFPPSLSAALCLLPWLRLVFRLGRHNLRQWLLGPLIEKGQQYWDEYVLRLRQQRALPRQRQERWRGWQLRHATLFEAAPPPGQGRHKALYLPLGIRRLSLTSWNPLGFDGSDEVLLHDGDAQVHPPPLGAVADRYEPYQTPLMAAVNIPAGVIGPVLRSLYVTPASVLQLVGTVLATPFAAAATGWLLREAAMALNPGNWLERALAVSAFRRPATANAAAATTAIFQGVPSLHWCNTLGLSLWAVLSSAASLSFRYHRLRGRAVARIEDRPFKRSIADGLILRDDDLMDVD